MTETKQKKKRQHYVPKFILRKFSPNEKSIALFAFKTQRKIPGASLKEQCYSDYFYGKDSAVEDGFCLMEGDFSAIIGDLSSEQVEKMSDEDFFKIKQYIHFQRARTMGAAEEVNRVNDELMRNLFAKFVDKNRHLDPDFAAATKEDIDEIHFETDKPQYMALSEAALIAPIVTDLQVKFLVNAESLGFIISDNPVVFQNQWAEHHPKFRRYSGITGLASKGLQIFMPLSPKICLVLFDPTTYQYGKKGSLLCSIGKLDVERLNILQALNAFDCIYFNNSSITDDDIKRLSEERQKFTEGSLPRVRDLKVFLSQDRRNPPSDMIGVRSHDLKIGAKFSFVQVIDRNSYSGYRTAILPVRSPELVEFTKSFRERLKGSHPVPQEQPFTVYETEEATP